MHDIPSSHPPHPPPSHPATPSLHLVAAFASSSMPRYAFIIKALDDEGWVRYGGYFQTEEDGWQFYCLFFPLILPPHGTYITVTVERTIVF
jgi:hypothetical protein